MPEGLIQALQWPAMVLSILAAWLVGSPREDRRYVGFWVFLASNVLWIAWGWPNRAWALVVLQVALGLMNFRGLKKADPDAP